ncbi:MAG: heavy metal-binding domain-containing protein [Elusimicrobiota bacterium]
MKLKLLCAFALVFACSPAFAEECGNKGDDCRQMKMGKMDSTHTMQKSVVEAGGKEKLVKATMRKVTKEEVGTEAVCPVMGNIFKVTAKTLSASYKGKVYYFCCPGCKKPFLENPEKFLQKKQETQAKVYVCPMGDYQGDKPGKCPKCGMDLVEKK